MTFLQLTICQFIVTQATNRHEILPQFILITNTLLRLDEFTIYSMFWSFPYNIFLSCYCPLKIRIWSEMLSPLSPVMSFHFLYHWLSPLIKLTYTTLLLLCLSSVHKEIADSLLKAIAIPVFNLFLVYFKGTLPSWSSQVIPGGELNGHLYHPRSFINVN